MNLHSAAPLAQTETLGLPAKPWSRRAIGRAYSGYTPLPADEYVLEICESEYAPNLGGTGMVLACRAQIVGGQYDGRPFYINYTLEHRDPQAVEIGQRDFAGLRRATSVLAPDDSEELHFKPFRVKIGVRPTTGANVIKQYLFERDDEPPTPRCPGVQTTEWCKSA